MLWSGVILCCKGEGKKWWFKKGLEQYSLKKKKSLVNPACFYVVLATNCHPENVINGPVSKNDCFKGEAASLILQVAAQEKEETLTQRRES